MGYAPRALLAGGLCFAASLLVACGGSSGLLSGGQANNLNSQLDQVSNAVTAGQCGTAQGAVSGLNNAIDNLPPSVNQTLVGNLRQGAATVSVLAQKDCHSTSTTTSSTSTSPTTSSSTSTSTSTSTSPSSTSTTSSSTTTSPTTSSATSSSVTGTSSSTSGSGGAAPGGTTTGGGGAGSGGGNP